MLQMDQLQPRSLNPKQLPLLGQRTKRAMKKYEMPSIIKKGLEDEVYIPDELTVGSELECSSNSSD